MDNEPREHSYSDYPIDWASEPEHDIDEREAARHANSNLAEIAKKRAALEKKTKEKK